MPVGRRRKAPSRVSLIAPTASGGGSFSTTPTPKRGPCLVQKTRRNPPSPSTARDTPPPCPPPSSRPRPDRSSAEGRRGGPFHPLQVEGASLFQGSPEEGDSPQGGTRPLKPKNEGALFLFLFLFRLHRRSIASGSLCVNPTAPSTPSSPGGTSGTPPGRGP